MCGKKEMNHHAPFEGSTFQSSNPEDPHHSWTMCSLPSYLGHKKEERIFCLLLIIVSIYFKNLAKVNSPPNISRNNRLVRVIAMFWKHSAFLIFHLWKKPVCTTLTIKQSSTLYDSSFLYTGLKWACQETTHMVQAAVSQWTPMTTFFHPQWKISFIMIIWFA